VAIVCGTDFSEGASHAVRVAVAFARAWGERLVLVHAVDLGALGWVAPRLREELARAAEERLAEVAAPLIAQGLAVDTAIRVGTPDEQVGALARACDARLAVVGVLGHRSAARWRIGSRAVRLARAAPAPVLLVPDAAPFEQCARRERALRVMVAAAPPADGGVAAGWLAALRRLGACDALLLHVYEPAREARRLGLPARTDGDGHPEVEAALRRALEPQVGAPSGPGATEVRATPVIGWVAETLALVAEREAFDLVLVVGRPRGGLARIRQDSVSEGLLRLAPAAVLRVPLAAAEAGA
jgi:universal stress protein A